MKTEKEKNQEQIQQQGLQQQQQNQRYWDIDRHISDSLKDLRTLLEKIDLKLDRILEKYKTGMDRRTIKTFLKNPVQYNLEFMPGVTLGELLKEKLGQGDTAGISKKLGIDSQTFNDILEDKILPDKTLSEKLEYTLKTRYGVEPDDFYICKAHTYTKIKILDDKSIDWKSIEDKVQQKMQKEEGKK